MSDEKSDIINDKIYVGHLYELDDKFMENFFSELTRAKRKEPRVFSVASNYYKEETSLLYAFSEEKGQDEAGNKVEFKYTLIDYKPTKSGLALIIDEIKTGSKMIIYRTYLNGEDRFFTETQLKYAKEIR